VVRTLRHFEFRIAYDGTEFHGFAASRGVRTVAGELARAVERIDGHPPERLLGSSRTDTGVHALDQCVLIATVTRLGPGEYARALQALTPSDIGVLCSREAPPEFDPRRDTVEKTYRYRIWRDPVPPVLERRFVWWIQRSLDREGMAEAAARLEGRHDFSAFRNRSKGETAQTVRTVREIRIDERPPELRIEVTGDGFLYRMVRNLVGTLVEVGKGALPSTEIASILAGRDRRRAGPSAPPQGLCLLRTVGRLSGPSASGSD